MQTGSKLRMEKSEQNSLSSKKCKPVEICSKTENPAAHILQHPTNNNKPNTECKLRNSSRSSQAGQQRGTEQQLPAEAHNSKQEFSAAPKSRKTDLSNKRLITEPTTNTSMQQLKRQQAKLQKCRNSICPLANQQPRAVTAGSSRKQLLPSNIRPIDILCYCFVLDLHTPIGGLSKGLFWNFITHLCSLVN
ncbi:hypothetical protein OWV82_003213 [Melia azedarach]|uniref:Uncharacterized protein n=1 Tax=Melia azedarach TaxID=155640 RepID=A0ACC1YLY2_MELAZ|nr:hypothetical protein OWV82_003213 [Melia azedarach]